MTVSTGTFVFFDGLNSTGSQIDHLTNVAIPTSLIYAASGPAAAGLLDGIFSVTVKAAGDPFELNVTAEAIDLDGINFVFVTGELATTPIPATLPLFATGLGALGLLGWRRKKRAALN